MRWFVILTSSSLLLMIAAVIVGCSTPASTEDETTTDLRQIAEAYNVIINMKNRPPKSADEIRQVLADLSKDGLNPPADEVLMSPRDKQPYVIIPGAKLGADIKPEILVYEKNGAEGKRYVFLMTYEVQQMTDEEFARATFAMGHKPGGN